MCIPGRSETLSEEGTDPSDTQATDGYCSQTRLVKGERFTRSGEKPGTSRPTSAVATSDTGGVTAEAAWESGTSWLSSRNKSVEGGSYDSGCYLCLKGARGLYACNPFKHNHTKSTPRTAVPDPGGGRIDEGAVRQSDVGQGPHRSAVPAIELDTHVLHLFPAGRQGELHVCVVEHVANLDPREGAERELLSDTGTRRSQSPRGQGMSFTDCNSRAWTTGDSGRQPWGPRGHVSSLGMSGFLLRGCISVFTCICLRWGEAGKVTVALPKS